MPQVCFKYTWVNYAVYMHRKCLKYSSNIYISQLCVIYASSMLQVWFNCLNNTLSILQICFRFASKYALRRLYLWIKCGQCAVKWSEILREVQWFMWGEIERVLASFDAVCWDRAYLCNNWIYALWYRDVGFISTSVRLSKIGLGL